MNTVAICRGCGGCNLSFKLYYVVRDGIVPDAPEMYGDFLFGIELYCRYSIAVALFHKIRRQHHTGDTT